MIWVIVTILVIGFFVYVISQVDEEVEPSKYDEHGNIIPAIIVGAVIASTLSSNDTPVDTTPDFDTDFSGGFDVDF